jgi:hypothetical protein
MAGEKLESSARGSALLKEMKTLVKLRFWKNITTCIMQRVLLLIRIDLNRNLYEKDNLLLTHFTTGIYCVQYFPENNKFIG